MTLTRKQRDLIEYLAAFISEHGYSPTYEEIAARFEYRSLSTVHEHIRNLVQRGMLRVEGKRRRSIEILRRDDRVGGHVSVFPPRDWLREPCGEYPLSPAPEADGGGLAGVRAYRERWRALRSEMLPGDELWTFRTPELGSAHFGGRAGYALVREGRVVDGVVTHDQLADPGAGGDRLIAPRSGVGAAAKTQTEREMPCWKRRR